MLAGESGEVGENGQNAEEDADSQQRNRHQHCCQDPFLTHGDFVEFGSTLGGQKDQNSVHHNKKYEAGFDHGLARALIRAVVGGFVGGANNEENEWDYGPEMEALDHTAATR